MHVRELTDPSTIGRFLERADIENAYQLGYLDDAYRDECHWYGAEDPTLQTVVLVYSGLSRPGLFTAGNPAGVRPILKQFAADLPVHATGHIARNHIDHVHSFYRDDIHLRLMARMGLRREGFTPSTDPNVEAGVELLTHRDTAAIMRLYTHWRDNFFEPYQLETGLYFGVRSDDGELACIAGIHNVSDAFDIAAIGNLVTHPDHRGRGLARRVTHRLLRAVFARVSAVTLDVEAGNSPAMRLYQHFGFQQAAEFWEGELQARHTG